MPKGWILTGLWKPTSVGLSSVLATWLFSDDVLVALKQEATRDFEVCPEKSEKINNSTYYINDFGR